MFWFIFTDVGSAIRPGSNQTVTEEHLRMSLLSAVEDKMKRRLREIFEQAQVMILFITDSSNVVYFYFEFRHCCTLITTMRTQYFY